MQPADSNIEKVDGERSALKIQQTLEVEQMPSVSEEPPTANMSTGQAKPEDLSGNASPAKKRSKKSRQEPELSPSYEVVQTLQVGSVELSRDASAGQLVSLHAVSRHHATAFDSLGLSSFAQIPPPTRTDGSRTSRFVA